MITRFLENYFLHLFLPVTHGKIPAMERLTAKEACELLGVSRMTLHRRIADGDIKPLPGNPAHKKRFRLEFNRADVERLKNISAEVAA